MKNLICMWIADISRLSEIRLEKCWVNIVRYDKYIHMILTYFLWILLLFLYLLNIFCRPYCCSS